MLPTEYTVFVVEGHEKRIKKDLLPVSSEPKEQRKSKTMLPSWVKLPLFQKLERFLTAGELSQVDIHSPLELQQLLWLGDILHLDQFLERLIQQQVIPNLNDENIFVVFFESQKKLKQCSDGPKFWYNLLNSCTSYIAANLYGLHQRHQEELKKINDKILAEILDRALKLLKKGGYQKKHDMFKLVMAMKEVADVAQLCRHLHEQTLKKKINQQIHANLAWKLVGLKELENKKTKLFKFIDYEWRLAAQAGTDSNGQRKLTISLLMERATGESEHLTNSNHPVIDEPITRSSSNTESSRTVVGTQYMRNDFVKIGVLYLKLVTKIEEDVYESDLRVSYINIDDNQSVDLLQFNSNQLSEIGKKRVDLTVYCNLEQVYTFVMNYMTENIDPSTISLDGLSAEQLVCLAKAYKKQCKFRQWFIVLSPLLSKKVLREQQVRPLLVGLDVKVATTEEVKKLQNLLAQQGMHRRKDVFFTQPHMLRSGYSQVSEIQKSQPAPELKVRQISAVQSGMRITATQLSPPTEVISLGISRSDSRGRGDSRSRLKKIFQSPRKPLEQQLRLDRNEAKKRLFDDLDIRNYIYKKDSAFYASFCDASM